MCAVLHYALTKPESTHQRVHSYHAESVAAYLTNAILTSTDPSLDNNDSNGFGKASVIFSPARSIRTSRIWPAGVESGKLSLVKTFGGQWAVKT